MSHRDGNRSTDHDVHDAVPQNVPTLIEIKKAIPKHCFESRVSTSFYYVTKDLILILLFYVTMTVSDQILLSKGSLLRVAMWPTYWFFQGTMMWALFVVAHDCGHGSFSNSTLLNDIVGNILNTVILVPYYAWKLSHRYHHKNTGNIDKDEIFYPVRLEKKREDNEQNSSLIPYWGLGLGWFLYLCRGYGNVFRNHFNPWDKLFLGRTIHVAISVILWSLWVCVVLPFYVKFYGISGLIFHYLIPIFVFASWLVIVTFLHHQDVNMPWYSNQDWDFVRGNLSSVDRHYGWAHELTHNIGTHQIHHLFIKIPHYHLEEATRAFRAKYPHLIRECSDEILFSFKKMFEIFRKQRHISSETRIHVYVDNKREKEL